MRSREDQIALDALRFLAKIGSQLDAFRAQLQQALDVTAISFVECRHYGTEVYLCVCLETDVDLDKTLTWWMDIRPGPDGWLIEASVLWNGRDIIARLPGLAAPDFSAVKREVPAMLKQLLDAGGYALAKAQPAQNATEDAAATCTLD
jgi:hypothetical protein